MKTEDMYNGISKVRPEFLEEADNYKPVKVFRWKRWVAVAACLCLLVAWTISSLPGEKSVSPFVITAYAMSNDGELIGTPIEIDQGAPMTQVELSTGKGGFLFSVDLEDKNEESQMNPFVLIEGSRSTEIEEVINRYTEEKGKAYFYFVPDEEVNVDGTWISVTLGFTKTDGSGVQYVLQIVKDNGVFNAKLIDVIEYPDGIPQN
ncbi:hypothetical protein [Gemmiger formicilis]|nr:hypothetical protein [Lachnospiraceae bacterium]